MTAAPDTPRLTFTDLAQAVDALRERGLRLTTPRRLVLEALFAADGPVSAERIAIALQLDPTSVYRNLETLEEHGLARHVHLGHGPGLYALIGRGEREFLSCERCGAVRNLTPEQLDPVREQIKQLFGYEARFTHFAIVGLCPGCARDRRSARRRAPAPAGDQLRSDDPHANSHEQSHAHQIHSHQHDAKGRHGHRRGAMNANPSTER
ncbi:MAG: transcriptional repressor [Solirubrobacteraceae bacterium]|jgi:Fur family transcriptional regulator, ferric uptake regulator